MLRLAKAQPSALLIGALGLCAVPETEAQSTFLFTGSQQPLASALITPVAEAPRPIFNWLEFIVGFVTEETSRPNVIPDSATVTVLFGDTQVTTIATIDNTGTVWRPETPGGLPLAPGSVVPVATTFPSVTPVLPVSSAYRVRVDLPPGLANLPVKVVLDLFDNLDSSRSIAFIGEVAVVPEPSVVGLLAAGTVFGLMAARRRP